MVIKVRLIDADKLCEDLLERWSIADTRKEELIRLIMADIVTPIVVSQPTIESERRKGKWLLAGNGMFPWECDQCGDTNERATPWCPHCGARMSMGTDSMTESFVER